MQMNTIERYDIGMWSAIMRRKVSSMSIQGSTKIIAEDDDNDNVLKLVFRYQSNIC